MAIFVVLLAAAAGCAGRGATPVASAAPTAPAPVCHDCFWTHQDPDFRDELIRFYAAHKTDDPLLRADVALLLARVEGNVAALCDAVALFDALGEAEPDPRRRLHAAETLAFTTQECGGDRGDLYRRAAEAADDAGETWKAHVYRRQARDGFRPVFGEAPIGRQVEVPENCAGFVLGESSIRVDASSRVGVQVERTVRDWISYQVSYDLGEVPPAWDQLLDYHEGARVREILRSAGATLIPLSGTLAARRGGRWYAPDETGLFRFEVLPDKIQYPTTRVDGDLALIPDTHGISSLVQRAGRFEATLVVGCGDYTGKAQAAYWLARSGVAVYFPCDRFVGDLLGHDAPGVLIGSAPVREGDGFAVIGDHPVRFDVNEPIVVQSTTVRGKLQYYDAPERYFRRLAEWLPLRLEPVEIDGAGQSDRVIERARSLGATAVALRVWTEEDYGPLRDWLAESPRHRAVLFHSAPYPAGNRLFHEFPRQTTFGDTRPRFLLGPATRM